MARIGIIVSFPDWYHSVRSMTAEDKDIIVRPGVGDDSITIADELIGSGVEVLIAGERTAHLIRSSNSSIPVVSVELTSYDIADAILRAKKFDKNIAIILYGDGFHEECNHLDFSTLFDCNVGVFTTEIDEDIVEKTVLQAKREGYQIVVGGKTVNNICERLGVPFEFSMSGKHAVAKALNHARNILKFKDDAMNELHLISGTMESASIGIIAVTKNGHVMTVNKTALKYLNKKSEQVIGNMLSNLFSENAMGSLNCNSISEIREGNLVINKRPLIIESAGIDAIITIEYASTSFREQENIRNLYIKKGHRAKYNFSDIKGNSAAIVETIRIARRYAAVESTLLIEGETGTGKEVLAQSIHNSSNREKGPFVAVNCAALTQSLLESELFGYVGGAFTGASKTGKAGLFEMADGGTIFLDEIGEMSLTTQAKLLRVLQEREVVRLGDDCVISIDVRIIAATNRSLSKMVEKSLFRADLYYRISVLKLRIPALKDRGEDVSILMQEFLQYYSKLLNRKKPSISEDCMACIRKYHWPGNIRELQNFCERIVTAFDKPIISLDMLYMIMDVIPAGEAAHVDKDNIMKALNNNGFNKSKTARELGISRTTLWKLIKEYEIVN